MHKPIPIPEDADYETLASLHNDILHLNPTIRVTSRHGKSTWYAVKLKKPVAERLCGYELNTGAHPLRLSFGYELDPDNEIAFVAVIEVADSKSDTWEPLFAEHPQLQLFLEYASDYLRQRHPYAVALLDIDDIILTRYYSKLT